MLAFLCLFGIKFSQNGFEDYMSPQKTGSIKGIFVIIVLLSHLRQYITLDGSAFCQPYKDFMNFFGQLMVVMFLFYSGYGVLLGIMKKDGYVKSIPAKRVLKVFIHFDIAVLLFWITGRLLGKDYSVKRLLLSLIGLDGVGNSVWFIFVIIVLYLVTFAAFIFLKKKVLLGTVITTVLSCGALLAIRAWKGSEYWWYDTILCYPLGMWYALAKPYIDKNILPDFNKWFACTAAAGTLFFAMKSLMPEFTGTRKLFIPMALVFAVFIVLLSMRISVCNGILQWFGKRVFGIYILQRIPMIVLSHFGMNKNAFLFSVACFALTIVIAEIFERAMDKLDILLHLSKKPVKKSS